MILFIEYSMEELSLAQHIMVDWSYGMFNMVNRALMGLFVNFKKGCACLVQAHGRLYDGLFLAY